MGTKRNIEMRTAIVVAVAAILAGFALSGCDDHVTVDRDPGIPIIRGMTWAWRPMEPPATPPQQGSSDRPVTSRDVIAGDRTPQKTQIENTIVRDRLKSAIEHTMHSKGLMQVGNPAQADFLVDYHIGIQNRKQTVATPVNRPTLVCGYYGCWNTWGWGYWGPPEVMLHTVHYKEGTLVFDLVQRAGNKLAFRAVSQKQVNNDIYSQDQINDGVKNLLKDLKPSK